MYKEKSLPFVFFCTADAATRYTHETPHCLPATFPATSWLDQLSYCALVDGARRVSKHSTSRWLPLCTLHFAFFHAVSSQTSNRLSRCQLISSNTLSVHFFKLEIYIYMHIYTHINNIPTRVHRIHTSKPPDKQARAFGTGILKSRLL